MKNRIKIFLTVLLLAITNTVTAKDSILNVSYDPTREFYRGYNELFAKYWKNKSGKEIDTVDRITVDAFKGALESGGHQILDVRKESEYEGGHVANAENKPLANINDWIRDINPAKHYLIHCAGGYRSMVAASILQARGYRNFSEIEGGYAAISQTEIPTTVVVAEKI